MTIAGTGHRLGPKLGGYEDDVRDRVYALALGVVETLAPTSVISGMAIGWDMAIAQAAVRLGIPFVAAVPFPGQAVRWPIPSRKEWAQLVQRASRVEWVTQPPAETLGNLESDLAWAHALRLAGGFGGLDISIALRKRNHWMVDQLTGGGDVLVALWNGEEGGRTWECVKYAEKQRVEVLNVWEAWREFQQPCI